MNELAKKEFKFIIEVKISDKKTDRSSLLSLCLLFKVFPYREEEISLCVL